MTLANLLCQPSKNYLYMGLQQEVGHLHRQTKWMEGTYHLSSLNGPLQQVQAAPCTYLHTYIFAKYSNSGALYHTPDLWVGKLMQ